MCRKHEGMHSSCKFHAGFSHHQRVQLNLIPSTRAWPRRRRRKKADQSMLRTKSVNTTLLLPIDQKLILENFKATTIQQTYKNKQPVLQRHSLSSGNHISMSQWYRDGETAATERICKNKHKGSVGKEQRRHERAFFTALAEFTGFGVFRSFSRQARSFVGVLMATLFRRFPP